jgi:hypothetical protein
MADDVDEDVIEASAITPKRVRVDGNEVEQRSVDELIKADEYKRKVTAAKNGIKGFRLGKFTFPGTV